MSLRIRRAEGETWREAAARYGKAHDLELDNGIDEGEAAWNACYEWDVLDFEP